MSISNEIIERYKKVAVATVYSALSLLDYGPCFMKGVKPFTPGNHLVGPAKTLRFIPPRKDIQTKTRIGEKSPEYVAMGSCEPGDVLVADGLGKKYGSVGGDVKLTQLKLRKAAGLVTDGAIRDLDVVKSYGFSIFASGRAPTGGGPEIDPFEANVAIQCGGVAVVPGDLIVGDDDGIVVVPEKLIEEVIDWVEEHEAVEEWIKAKIEKEDVSPGKYYPITTQTIEDFHQSQDSQK